MKTTILSITSIALILVVGHIANAAIVNETFGVAPDLPAVGGRTIHTGKITSASDPYTDFTGTATQQRLDTVTFIWTTTGSGIISADRVGTDTKNIISGFNGITCPVWKGTTNIIFDHESGNSSNDTETDTWANYWPIIPGCICV